MCVGLFARTLCTFFIIGFDRLESNQGCGVELSVGLTSEGDASMIFRLI